ncbi:MAG: hypothetical protein J6X01_08060 [Bacteroidales bacterium]|nr:hypothetical protein [Bacteroidales bacterium]
MRKILILWLLLCSWGMMASAQTDLFVSSAAADDSHSGYSWENAKKTIGAALNMAEGTTIIHVMVGNYELPAELIIPAGVTVRGGYLTASTGTDLSQRRNPGSNSYWNDPTACTILSGQHQHRIATVQNGSGLEACVVRDGLTNSIGGGVLIQGGSVFNCVITNCMAYNHENMAGARGGGVYLQSGQLNNCVVCYNRAGNGYGVAGMSGSAVNNTITQNYGIHCGTLIDVDHNEYTTVVIGEQCWMRENLRTTHYADGESIAQGAVNTAATAYYYNPFAEGAETRMFGLLYNLRAVRRASHDSYSEANPSGMQGICPDGWHLPSLAEFNQMLHFLGLDTANICGESGDNLAKSLASNEQWAHSDVTCAVGNDLTENNLSLFSAMPAGIVNTAFQGMYQQCRYWTSSRDNGVNSRCVYWGLSFDNATVQHSYTGAECFYSVRCVKDN